MLDTTLCCPEVLYNYLIEIVGETVEKSDSRFRRIAAKEVVKFYTINTLNGGQAALVFLIQTVDLKHRLPSPSTYFAQELVSETEPYSAEGILFPALVHLVRIEEDMFAYGWLPEQLRALGLAIKSGEELDWPINRDFVSIKDREGNVRSFPRFSG
jgi:hypothetical protein